MLAFERLSPDDIGTLLCRRLALALALALGAATARAGSRPNSCLDACTGGEGTIRVTGWAFDRDASSQSLDIHVYFYADSGCTIQYGDIRVLKANVSRPDVNQAWGITGSHGFNAEIPISNAGDYWVKVFAIDATGDGNPQIGATATATVTAAESIAEPAIIVVEATNTVVETFNTVNVTRFHQSYPYSGRATIEYTVGGRPFGKAVAEITLSTDDTSATFVQSNIVRGANSHVIDFASSFGGALLLTNASFTVTVTVEIGGVQLWENGPYWAECNVGATRPEEYGYYFWWGDTVGYTNTGSGWISVKDGRGISFSNSGAAATTYYKDNSELLSACYIDLTGNLMTAHDAAAMNLGSPWRMPTYAEFSALLENCHSSWATVNGVPGFRFRGKGNYADRSIFLPAAGFGHASDLDEPGEFGCYWSSSPYLAGPGNALEFYFDEFDLYWIQDPCFVGLPVRPVRGFAQ